MIVQNLSITTRNKFPIQNIITPDEPLRLSKGGHYVDRIR